MYPGEKRASERLSVNLQARMFFGNMVYAGWVANLSENGMFLCTKMTFPIDTFVITSLKAGDTTYNLATKIKRTVKPDIHEICHEESGLGMMILNPPEDYLGFISETRASL